MTAAVPSPTLLACLWCGAPLGNDADHLLGRTRCRRCGAATTDPFPSDEELAAAYGDWYRPQSQRRFFFAGDAILSRSRAMLASRIDRTAPPGAVLDVGAGDGTLVDALRAHGREATGLEREATRPDFLEGSVTELRDRWAAIVFWHSLEHLPDPGAAIQHAASLLEPGGVLVVAVPNNDSLQARAFGDRWLHLDIPRHLVHLSATSLAGGLRGNGLRVENVSYLRSGQTVIGWLQGLVGLLPGQPDLYQALRRSNARGVQQPLRTRFLAIAAAVLLTPFAMVAGLSEIALRRGGTVCMEARRV